MTKDEAVKIAHVISNADGGCSVCVDRLCKDLSKEGLGFRWSVIKDDGTYNGYGVPVEVTEVNK